MAGSGITFAGLGSGIDTTSIINQLVALERLPLTALENQKKGVQSKISTLGTLKGYVKDLQAKAKALGSKKDFLEFAVKPSEEGVASFSASGNAAPGNHSISITRLAAIDRWAFHGVTDPTTDLADAAGQQVAFDIDGTNYSITVQQGESSLNEIAGAINDLAGEKVQASVVNTGTSATPSYKLVLTSTGSGEDSRISNIASTVAGLAITYTAPDGSGAATSADNITVGNNAIALIDGLQVERETNEFNDVITGVSINATAADALKTITFSVEADKDAVKKKIHEFTDAYNKIISFVNTQNSYNEDSGPGGDLFGDSILDTVRSRVNGALFGVSASTVAADTEGYSTLSLVGIKKLNDGTLIVNDTDLEEKMADNLDAFADLFVDSDGFDNGGALENTPGYYTDTSTDSGLAASLDRAIDRMMKSSTGEDDIVIKGVFDSRTEKYNADISRYGKQIEAKEFYLDQFRTNLVTRFAKLEQLIGGLNAQGASLQAALGGN